MKIQTVHSPIVVSGSCGKILSTRFLKKKTVLFSIQALIQADRLDDMVKFMKGLPDDIRNRGRMQIMEARAAMQMGDLQRVEEILQSKPSVADVREGEVTLSNLWFEMHEKRIAANENIPVDDNLRQRVRKNYPPPSWLDFRQS